MPGRRAESRASTPTRRRLAALARTEVRLLRRFGVVPAAVVVTALWVAIMALLPPATRRGAVPFVLLIDVAALGFLFVPAVLVVERTEGAEALLRLTRARPSERLGVRIGLVTGLSLSAAFVVTVAAGTSGIPVVLLGVATTSALTGVMAAAAIGSSATLTTFLLRAPLIAGPLLAPALAHATGLLRSPLLHLSPMTSAMDLLHGRLSLAGLVWQLVWVAGAWTVAVRSVDRPSRPRTATTPRRAAAWPPHPGEYEPVMALRSFVRADRRSLVRDGLLVMLAASVPLVAGVARIVGTAGVTWARDHHGLDLAPALPAVWVVLLVVHTPLVFGTLTGLLLLEDRDAGVLPAIATTRASLATLLGYRLGATAMCSAAALAIGFAIAGIGHAAGGAGVVAVAVAATAVSMVPALLMAAFAGNRVQGVAVMKILGLPLYLPLASWFVDGPLRWTFAPLPSSWAMWAMWAGTPATAAAFAAGAVAASLIVALPLARRVLRTT